MSQSDLSSMTLASWMHDAVQSWRLALFILFVSFIASIAIVRFSDAKFEARTKVIESRSGGNDSLSMLSSAAGLSSGDSGLRELRAVITSRRLAEALVDDPLLRPALIQQFPHRKKNALGSFKNTLMYIIFGVHNSDGYDIVSTIQQSLERDISVEQTDNVMDISYKSSDKTFSSTFLKYIINHSQSLVISRQRERAVKYQDYIFSLIQENAGGKQDSLQALSLLVPNAVSQVAQLSGPSARSFDQLDMVYVSPNPVSPRIGLIVAVCLALGALLFFMILMVRRLNSDA